MSPDEREEKETQEIMAIYNKKYGEKSLFDELWEKDHPEEAKKMKLEQAK